MLKTLYEKTVDKGLSCLNRKIPNFNICAFLSADVLSNELESVGSGLGLLGLHPGPSLSSSVTSGQ